MDAQYEQWANQAATYFQTAFGLAGAFALPCARLFIALWSAGLAPRITRGWSDPAHQMALQRQWDAGNHAGLRVRPATNSLHTKSTWLGQPAAAAIDMPTTDDTRAAKIAATMGIGAGLNFAKEPDPGHYYLIGAS